MLAGISTTDITPPPGTDMTGYLARTGPATGIHDRLYCRALVLDDGTTRAALIETDTLGFGLEYTRHVKRLIEAETGIPAGNIMLAATHTHGGPASVLLDGCGELAIDWLAGFPAKAVEAVRRAQADLEEVEVATGRAEVTGVGINRRDRVAGPRDDELTVVSLRRDDGSVKGALLHYTCHAVVLGSENREISADYPGAACARAEALTGAPCIFMQGPCGDINPTIHPGSFEAVAELGGKVGEAAAALINGSDGSVLAEPILEVSSQSLALPLGPLPSFEELIAYREEQMRAPGEVEEQFRAVRAKVSQAMQGWAERTIGAYCSGLLKTEVDVDIQSLRLGDLYLIAVPGELFVEFGLEAKRLAAEKGQQAAVIAYANGDIGYIPTPWSYDKGGYEVLWAYKYYGYPAALAPEAGAMVRQAIADALS